MIEAIEFGAMSSIKLTQIELSIFVRRARLQMGTVVIGTYLKD